MSVAKLSRQLESEAHGFPELKISRVVAATGLFVSAMVAVVGNAPTKPVAVSLAVAARIEL